MIRIGDFSKHSRVPIKTLRYYDELGLLKPVETDPFTGYRYYHAGQMQQLNRILALKDLGLSLEQIGRLLDGGLPTDQMVGILRQKQVELEQEVQNHQEMLNRVKVRLHEFEQEKTMSTLEVVIKSIPEIRIASIRGIVPTYMEQGHLWDTLDTAIRKAKLKVSGPCFTLDHDPEYKEKDHDLEVCEPISGGTSIDEPAVIRILPAAEQVACYIHKGSFQDLHKAYEAMIQWIDEHGYQICDVGREIYHQTSDGPVRQDDPGYITEIQFPVRKP